MIMGIAMFSTYAQLYFLFCFLSGSGGKKGGDAEESGAALVVVPHGKENRNKDEVGAAN